MQVFISPLAQEKTKLLLEYLEEEWSIKVKEDFIKKLTKSVGQISKQPYSCPQSKETKIFKCVVSKQTSFFYRIKSEDIEIITLIDNRQNPKEIKDWLNKNFG